MLVCKASQKSNEMTYMHAKLLKNATSILREQILTLVYAIAHTSFVLHKFLRKDDDNIGFNFVEHNDMLGLKPFIH